MVEETEKEGGEKREARRVMRVCFMLWGTGIRDVEIEADAFLLLQQMGTKGIRVRR
jgi:hypothetical protein